VSFLERIRDCNRSAMRQFRPFIVAGERVGWIKPAFASALRDHPDVFLVSDDSVRLHPSLGDAEARSEAVLGATRSLAEAGVIFGWRDEPYAVTPIWGLPPLLRMERAAVPYFGVRAFGVHMNGFVREGGRLLMWVARRARDKPTYPGMLDNLVAGGQPDGVSLMDNLVKECAEEAAIGAALARRAVPTGAITYAMETRDGLSPGTQFVYELELPPGFEPRNEDGEVIEFHLWPIEQVAELVRDTCDFKANCNLVIIHFLLRHGLLPADHPDYRAILGGLTQ
jgi:8-oxo-dGTP pyrophosphatase MutT (NUDIX family)